MDEQQEYAAHTSDEQYLKLYHEAASRPSPDSQVLPRLLEFAKTNQESPFAFDSLAFSIWRGGTQTGELHGTAWRIKEEAITVVREHHMADSRIAILFTLLEGAIPSRRTEEFLRYGFKMGHNREARAAAGLALAKYLHYRDQYERRSLRLLKQKEIRNAFDRHWKLVITPHLQKLPYDKDESIAEIERLLQAVASDYANVESSGWRFYGPGKILLERVPQPRRETYGALARALTNERTRVAPGQRAIEIFGRDSESKRFRLSDYEGKAVLLTFSADWCVSCKELYPIKRKLIERFKGKPFVVLSVSRDVKIETLKASRSSGEITWRCWWDGLEGPIADSWHVASAPAIFLLNADHVIEDIELLPTSSFEDYEQAISIALGKPQG